MRIHPKDIARALVDSVASQREMAPDAACDSAIQLLHKKCPGTSRRIFFKLVEREVLSRGAHSAGMLVVPHDHAASSEHIATHLKEKTGKAVHLERMVEPELIGGAVLLVDHRRIDCSIQGALHTLLRMCLQPLD
jgi:hypothetical protein